MAKAYQQVMTFSAGDQHPLDSNVCLVNVSE